jgi:hypothetical protein
MGFCGAMGCSGRTGEQVSTLRMGLQIEGLNKIMQAQTEDYTDANGRFMLERSGLYLRLKVTASDLSPSQVRIYPQKDDKLPADDQVQFTWDVPAGTGRDFEVLAIIVREEEPSYFAPPQPLTRDLQPDTELKLDISLEPLIARVIEGKLSIADASEVAKVRLIDVQEKLVLPWITVEQAKFTTKPLPIGRVFAIEIELKNSQNRLLQTSLAIEEGDNAQLVSITK